MITMRNVGKRFGALDVLRCVDLEIRQGRITAIVGPNASGKTTLIKAILGLVHPDRGDVTFDGSVIGNELAYRQRIGYMPQSARFPEHMTGAQLIGLMMDLRGVTPAAVDRDLIDRFALEPQLAKPLRTLSGGTRQKVNAVLAFLFNPDLLILDEPTAGLDPLSSRILKDKIVRSREAGRTFLLTSHIMSELEELADDVAFLLDGRVRFAGPVHDLKVRTREFTLERALAKMMMSLEAA
jgi:Cu-processing system ATP-binding protein